MKLFRNKNRGPKVKREDVVIPEEYLEYERLSEEKRHREAASAAAEGDKILDDDVMAQYITGEGKDQPPDQAEQVEEAPEEKPAHHLFKIENRKKTEDAPEEKDEVFQEEPPLENDQTDETPSRRSHHFPWAAAAIILLVLIVAGATTALLSPLMAIDKVEVNGLKTLTETQVLKMAGQPEGKNIFLFRVGNAEKEIALYPYVKSVEVRRQWPHALEITIEERQPAGLLLDNGNYLKFSKDGILLDNSSTLSGTPLPIITGFSMSEVPAPGEKFKDDDRFKDALAVINACTDDLLSMLQEINIEDRQNILAYTSQGLEIRIGSIDNINARMADLNDIMNQVILSGAVEEPIKAIDIRYEKAPVIVLADSDETEISADDLTNSDQNNNGTSGTDTSSATDQNADSSTTAADDSQNTAASTSTASTDAAATGNSQSASQSSQQTTDAASAVG